MVKPARRLVAKPDALVFSPICGKGITLSDDRRTATRSSGFGDAIVFSSRTLRTFERVFLRHRQKEGDWIGSLRVGFCSPDPQTRFTHQSLPSLAFKHLSGRCQ